MTTPSQDVARFYTRARKFPQMLGRLPDGTRIWGGPYTFTQFGIGFALGVLTLMLRPLWSTGGFLDVLVVFVVVAGGTYLGRYIPQSQINIAVVLSAATRAWTAPPRGRYRGRPVVLPKPHRLHASRVAVARPCASSARRATRAEVQVAAEVSTPAVAFCVEQPEQVETSPVAVAPGVGEVHPVTTSEPKESAATVPVAVAPEAADALLPKPMAPALARLLEQAREAQEQRTVS